MRNRPSEVRLTRGICPTTIGHLFECIATAQGGEPWHTCVFWTTSSDHARVTIHARYVPPVERNKNQAHDPDKATPQEFAAWLRQQLERRGYDLRPRGGGQTKFAKDSGIGAGSVSRMLSSEGHVPGLDVLEQLAKAFDLDLAEVMVAAGVIRRSLLHAIREQAPRPDQLTPEQAAADLGITDPTKVQLFVSMTETLRDQRTRNGEGNVAEN